MAEEDLDELGFKHKVIIEKNEKDDKKERSGFIGGLSVKPVK